MKLTKAQRLFIKAGEAQAEIAYWKWVDQETSADDDSPDCSEPIAIRKKRRKKLLREALEAARSENTEHYMNGINEVLRLITLNTLRRNEKTGLKPYNPEAAIKYIEGNTRKEQEQ